MSLLLWFAGLGCIGSSTGGGGDDDVVADGDSDADADIDCPEELGWMECDGICVDTQNDGANCGFCRRVCDLGEECAGGRCAEPCPSGVARCGGACVDTNEDARNCGGCGVACAPGSGCTQGICVDESCSSEAQDREVFSDDMVGCAGSVGFGQRSGLCGAGWYPCSALEWRDRRAGAAPTYDYWTDDPLRYGGSSGSCWVSTSTGTDCGATTPMRVCAASGADPLGNACTWADCGYGAELPNEYFGGCAGNLTAGTLCCR